MYLARGLARPSSAEASDAFDVTVVTQTPEGNKSDSGEMAFRVERKPDSGSLWKLVGEADRILLAGPAILPLAFALVRGKRVIVTHHGYQAICPNGLLFYLPSGSCCAGHFAAGRYSKCIECNTKEEGLFESIKGLMLTFVRRALCQFASENVSVSEHVAKRIALRRSKVIRNGVPDARSPVQISGAGNGGAPVRFAYVGRLVTEKGVSVLVDAAARLKNLNYKFKVLIIGDGPVRPELEARAASEDLGEHMEFLGFQTGNSLRQLLGGVSAVVMPSLWEDAAPFSALEQMVEARLLIGSKIGGLAEQIGDAGLTFTPGNAEELSERMRLIIERPEVGAERGRVARERALKWYMLDRLIAEYRELLYAE